MLNLAFALRFLLAALALYRMAMFTRDDGPFGWFLRFREYLGKRAAKDEHPFTFRWTLAELSNCPHCLGIWLSFLLAPAVIWPSSVTDIILLVLALAGLQSYLTGRSED